MSADVENPMERTVKWLASRVGFPARRLDARAETLLCVGMLAEAQERVAQARFLIERRDGAKDSALRAHAMRRSLVHYKCDNSAKV